MNDPTAPLPQPSAWPLTVAVVGIGQMGLAMALRLHQQGCTVRVFDTCAQRNALAQQAGLTVCKSAAHAAQGAAALVLAVVDAAQCQAVLFGTDSVDGIDGVDAAGAGAGAGAAGAAAGALAPGSAVLVCPTIGPDQVQSLAAPLLALGLQVLDAPMSGGPQRARQGRMSLMVAAPKPVFDHWQPLLNALADPVFHVGPTLGQGASTKLVNNLLAAVNLAGACEAMALAQTLGLNAATTLRVMQASSGQSWIGNDRLQRALANDTTVHAATALLAKDSSLALQAAHSAGANPVLGAAAQKLFAQACVDGRTHDDDSALLGWTARGWPQP